jgi:hypothetical protein
MTPARACRRNVALAVAGLLVVGATGPAGAGQLAAQAVDGAEDAARICFRGRPLPACRSFWIVEMQAYTPLSQSSRMVRYSTAPPVPLQSFEEQLEWNFGHMVNVTPDLAIGGLLTLGTGAGSGAFAGLKGRVRRWLGPQVSVEVEGGLLRSGVVYPPAHGVTADVRLNIGDHGSFFVRWDGIDVSGESIDYGGGYGFHDAGGFQQALSVGAGVGSKPALVGTGVLGLGWVILLGAFLAGDAN